MRRLVGVIAIVILAGCATMKKEEVQTQDGPSNAALGSILGGSILGGAGLGAAGAFGLSGLGVAVEGKAKLHPYTTVETFFATDRNVTLESNPGKLLGPDRGAGNIVYGSCQVSFPLIHLVGELESPSIFKLEFKENPEKHVVLQSSQIRSKESFYADVAKRIKSDPDNNAFVFVHGYNVNFEDAARRTAQMAFDLGFKGAPVFYTWPSQGNIFKYTVDENNIQWSQPHFSSFLEEFFDHSKSKNIYLVAHSMGNRALTQTVIALLAKRPEFKDRLKEIILAAPDIDAQVFKEQIAPAMTAFNRPITLYASSEDKPLGAPAFVHGYARAGDSGNGLIIYPGIETIDASSVDTGFLGHSYFGDERTVLSDIYYIVRDNLRADKRFGLRGIDTTFGRYWEFLK